MIKNVFKELSGFLLSTKLLIKCRLKIAKYFKCFRPNIAFKDLSQLQETSSFSRNTKLEQMERKITLLSK